MPGLDTGKAGTEAEQFILRCTNFKVRYQAFNVTEVSNGIAVYYLGYIGRVDGL